MRPFRPGWGMSVLVAVLTPALVGLGGWQLERADQKEAYQARLVARLGAPAEPPPPDPEDAPFLRVRLEGRYRVREHYLVDNRVRDGRPGYWVVSRFEADDGRVFLVNRGWLAAPQRRGDLPRVPTPAAPLSLEGVVWPDLGLPPLLAPDPWPERWPKRVQRLEVARMAAEGERVVPAEVRLEGGQPGVFEPAPVAVDFAAERHRGYAVQWFALAAVLSVGYVVFGFRRT